MKGMKVFISIFVLQSIYAGMAIFGKAAMNGGMNTAVFVFYRQAFATAVMIPVALIFGRRSAPPLPFKMTLKIFLLALLAYTCSFNVYMLAIKNTTATVVTASLNMIPVVTFFLSFLFRMEAMNYKSFSGIMKILGIIFCMAGVAVLAFYKGPRLKSFNHHHNNERADITSNKSWIRGIFFMLIPVLSWSLNIIFQGLILKEYPAKVMFSTLSCIFSTLQSFIVAVIAERNFSEWKLHFDDKLLAVLYGGIMMGGVGLYLQVWCVEKKGPVFVAMSSPLALLIALACSSLLAEVVNLSSILGGGLMVIGLYSVLWAKSREEKVVTSNPNIEDGSNQNQN